MAWNSATVVKMARILANTHIIVGSSLICLGVVERFSQQTWMGTLWLGVWTGGWVLITGVLGTSGTGKDRTATGNVYATVFMGFSIASTLLAVPIIAVFSVEISYSERSKTRNNDDQYYASIAISVLIVILGIVQFVIGIWAAVCVCLMKPCPCCKCCKETTVPQEQAIYTANNAYVQLTQERSGFPVVTQVEADGRMNTAKLVTPGTQRSQPQLFEIPISGAEG